MRRFRKKYEGPFKPWDYQLLMDELKLLGEYGLKNKRELRRAATLLKKFRTIARQAYGLPEKEKREVEKTLVGKLNRMGILNEDASLDDVLRLEVKDILERRLQTLVYRKGLAKSIYMARQMVVHRHIVVGDRVEDRPGRIIYRDEEDKIGIRPGSPYSDPNHPIWKEGYENVEGEAAEEG